MTVPTAGNRPELLSALIRDCGLPPERVIVVATQTGVVVDRKVVVVEDLESPNIQRWWNLGIEEAKRRGAEFVAVVNDDVSVTPDTLPQLARALRVSAASVASPRREPYRDGLHTGPLVPYSPRLWGSLWMLKVSSGLRPDTRYVWWYGDNDLDIRARRHHGGVVLVPVAYSHVHPGEGTSQSRELQAQTQIDAETFERQYRYLLRASRLWTRFMPAKGVFSSADSK